MEGKNSNIPLHPQTIWFDNFTPGALTTFPFPETLREYERKENKTKMIPSILFLFEVGCFPSIKYISSFIILELNLATIFFVPLFRCLREQKEREENSKERENGKTLSFIVGDWCVFSFCVCWCIAMALYVH